MGYGKELGLLIKRARKKIGISQDQLAARINSSQPVISRIEKGLDWPDPDMLAKIVVQLGAFHLLAEYCRVCPVRLAGLQAFQSSSVAAMTWMVGKLRDDADLLEVMCKDGNTAGYIEHAYQLREALDTFLSGLE